MPNWARVPAVIVCELARAPRARGQVGRYCSEPQLAGSVKHGCRAHHGVSEARERGHTEDVASTLTECLTLDGLPVLLSVARPSFVSAGTRLAEGPNGPIPRTRSERATAPLCPTPALAPTCDRRVAGVGQRPAADNRVRPGRQRGTANADRHFRYGQSDDQPAASIQRFDKAAGRWLTACSDTSVCSRRVFARRVALVRRSLAARASSAHTRVHRLPQVGNDPPSPVGQRGRVGTPVVGVQRFLIERISDRYAAQPREPTVWARMVRRHNRDAVSGWGRTAGCQKSDGATPSVNGQLKVGSSANVVRSSGKVRSRVG